MTNLKNVNTDLYPHNEIPFTLNFASQVEFECDTITVPNYSKNSNYNSKRQVSNYEFGVFNQGKQTKDMYDSGVRSDGTPKWDWFEKNDD